jgi:hypothetical protein
LQLQEEAQQQAQDQKQPQDRQQARGETQAQDQTQADKESDEKEGADDDDGSVNAALGLINTGPVQMKSDLEQPVTSGGMDTMTEIPGTPD